MSAYCGKYKDELIRNAAYIGTPGKGILAADESTGTIGKRLASIGVENVEENRRALRELLFTAPGALDCLSGVILFEETLYQSTRDGTPFVDVLAAAGVLAGIKVDKGTVELAGTDRETTTQGHDGLGERCRRYYAAGARFAKWRAVLSIGGASSRPSQLASEEEATRNLNAMNQVASRGKKPWSLTFSFGRALQQSTLKAWAGKAENVGKAQAALLARCRANSQATLGAYAGDAAAGEGVSESLHVKDYKY
uniref:fructose-bisphosphate aldolase n=1 Tax=Oryza barthii TaxID=65489 RepID=A0A0D3GVV0_9ORYZ